MSEGTNVQSRQAAAEARRQKVLARTKERMSHITTGTEFTGTALLQSSEVNIPAPAYSAPQTRHEQFIDQLVAGSATARQAEPLAPLEPSSKPNVDSPAPVPSQPALINPRLLKLWHCAISTTRPIRVVSAIFLAYLYSQDYRAPAPPIVSLLLLQIALITAVLCLFPDTQGDAETVVPLKFRDFSVLDLFPGVKQFVGTFSLLAVVLHDLFCDVSVFVATCVLLLVVLERTEVPGAALH